MQSVSTTMGPREDENEERGDFSEPIDNEDEEERFDDWNIPKYFPEPTTISISEGDGSHMLRT